METNAIICAECKSDAKITCSGCGTVSYCTKEHQKNSWKAHKEVCKPFIVRSNVKLGRYLETTKLIKQGELILKETPTLIGPQIQSPPLCLNCHTPVSPQKHTTCQKCKIAPFCTVLCNGNQHSQLECQMLSTSKLTKQFLLQNCQIVMPLRCLLLRKSDENIWNDFITMESHLEKREGTPIWRNHKLNVEDVLYSQGFLNEDDLRNNTAQKICGILDVNTFELRPPSICSEENFIRGIYRTAALMAHDCVANTHLAVDDDFNLIVHASVQIPKGFPVYFNYTNSLKSTSERQEHLREGKYFNCLCKRCTDPTELGSNMSALKCTKCFIGCVLPNNPVDSSQSYSVWKCSNKKCKHECKGNMVNTANYVARNEIEDIDRNDVRSVEKLLNKLLFTYPPENSLILELKMCLSGLYSNILGGESNASNKTLKRKQLLCKEVLDVLENVEPGISRLKGIMLYEMHIPIVMLANKEYEVKNITASALVERLKDAEEVLKKAVTMLLYEPNASPEGRLAARAMKELKLLRNSIQNVNSIQNDNAKKFDKKKQSKHK